MDTWSYDVASDLVKNKSDKNFIGYWRSKTMLCEQVLGKLHDFDTTGKP